MVSKEEQELKVKEILEKHYTGKEDAQVILDAMYEYAKWYASKVIDRCAEEANLHRQLAEEKKIICIHEIFAHNYFYMDGYVIVNKNSILKLKEEL